MEIVQPLSNGITVYSKSGCSFCDKLKLILYDTETFPFEELNPRINQGSIPFTIVNCDDYIAKDKAAFLNEIQVIAKKEYTSFPMVFWDAQFLGGYQETVKQIQKRLAHL